MTSPTELRHTATGYIRAIWFLWAMLILGMLAGGLPHGAFWGLAIVSCLLSMHARNLRNRADDLDERAAEKVAAEPLIQPGPPSPATVHQRALYQANQKRRQARAIRPADSADSKE